MKLQILVSTTDDRFFLNQITRENFLVINQLITKPESDFSSIKDNYSFYEKGLSKSRNRAILKSNADVCLISDDDLEYLPDFEAFITEAFLEYPKADIITFQALTPQGELYKQYQSSPFWHTQKTILKVSSVEIAFKRKTVVESDIRFDELFGLGSKFPTGEEAIFLMDALKHRLKVLYLPIPIVVHPEESSGKSFADNEELIKAKGAMFYRLFGRWSYGVCALFALNKYRLSNISLVSFYRCMLKGVKEYKEVRCKKN